MENPTKVREQYIELYRAAYGFSPSPLNIDRYMQYDADMRHAVREKLKQHSLAA